MQTEVWGAEKYRSMNLYEVIWIYLIFDMYEILYAMPTIDGFFPQLFLIHKVKPLRWLVQSASVQRPTGQANMEGSGSSGNSGSMMVNDGKRTSHQVWSMIVNEFMSMLIVIDHDQ